MSRNYATVFLLNKQLYRGHTKKEITQVWFNAQNDYLKEAHRLISLLVVLPSRQLKQGGCYLPRIKKKHRERGKENSILLIVF